MAATSERITFIQQEFRRAVAEDTAVRTRHGNLARESEDPVPTWFDNVPDALLMAHRRLELQSAERRRFRLRTVGADTTDALDYQSGWLPVVRYVDSERLCDRKAIVGNIIINLGQQNSGLEVWG